MTQELYDKLYGAPVTATTQAPAQTRSSDFLKELPTWVTPQSTPSVATGAPAGYVANPIVGKEPIYLADSLAGAGITSAGTGWNNSAEVQNSINQSRAGWGSPVVRGNTTAPEAAITPTTRTVLITRTLQGRARIPGIPIHRIPIRPATVIAHRRGAIRMVAHTRSTNRRAHSTRAARGPPAGLSGSILASRRSARRRRVPWRHALTTPVLSSGLRPSVNAPAAMSGSVRSNLDRVRAPLMSQ